MKFEDNFTPSEKDDIVASIISWCAALVCFGYFAYKIMEWSDKHEARIQSIEAQVKELKEKTK